MLREVKESNKKNIQYFVAFLILLAIIFTIWLRKEKGFVQTQNRIVTLPNFSAIDVNNNEIRTSQFSGKNTYVQFVNSRINDDIFLLKKVIDKWGIKDLEILAITNNLEQFKSKINSNLDNMSVIYDEDKKLINKFNSTYSESSFYLFDKSGKIIISSINDIGNENVIKVHLNELIYKKKFLISDFIPVNKNVHEVEGFKEMSDIFIKNNRPYVIAMFNSFCFPCLSGAILEKLKKIAQRNKNLEILIILSRDYNETDANNFKSHLKVEFTTLIADLKLNEKWSQLGKDFIGSYVNDIIFVIDNKGIIGRVAYPNCECYLEFFNLISSLFDEVN